MPRALVVLIVVVAACGGSPTAALAPDHGIVTKVVDGDTLDVDLAGGTERVRLLGIDTPESVTPDRPVECHGPEASAALADLVPVGTEVRLERDVEARDRFGRLLAYVFRAGDDVLVNEALAAGGHADQLTITPNTAYRDRIADAVSAAAHAGLGMWGACG